MNLWKRQPALILGFIQALLVVAISFGLQLTLEQTGAILTALAALTALITKTQVTSPYSAEVLARGVKSANPSNAARNKASQILGVSVPPQVFSPQLRAAAELVQHLLPAPAQEIFDRVGVIGLEFAIQSARNGLKTTPTEADLEAHIRGQGL